MRGIKYKFCLIPSYQKSQHSLCWAVDGSKVEYAREAITEVIEKRKTKRDKHINIADGSDGGWETVRQYQNNPVASCSDDETTINKAENRVLRKNNSKGKNAAVKPRMEVKMLLLNMLLLFQLIISPFVSLKHGTMDLLCTMDNPCLARADINVEVNNKEHVMAVDLSNTGEANVLSTPYQPCQNENKIEFIKDKYGLITTDIDSKFELSVNELDNLTHDLLRI